MTSSNSRVYAASTNDQDEVEDYTEDWQLVLSTNGEFELTIIGMGFEGADSNDTKTYKGNFAEDGTSITLKAHYFEHNLDFVPWENPEKNSEHSHKIDSNFSKTWKLIKQNNGNHLQPSPSFTDFNMILKKL